MAIPKIGSLWPYPVESLVGGTLALGDFTVVIDAARLGALQFERRRVAVGLAPSSGDVLIAAIIGQNTGIAQFSPSMFNLKAAANALQANTARKLTVALVSAGYISDLVEPPCDPLFWDVFIALLRGNHHGTSSSTGKPWAFRQMGRACLNNGTFRTV